MSGNALKQGHRTYSVLPWASEGFYQGGPLGYFCKFFPGGPKVVKFVFFPLKTKKNFFAENFKIQGGLPSLTPFRRSWVLRQSSSQLQKYKVVHSKSAVKHTTLRWGSSQIEKMTARMSRRIALEQRRYAAGMVDTMGWQFATLWTSLHKNWKSV